ncbi:MAG: protein phosphatase 2C domain-containing protein [Candidatus Competibacteraceae bacterium]|jgi:protein phosphatase|nr:protein phosphatase 2C domain-containing protein [Candidatus Competibacteraceae bacterium]
MSWEYGAGTHVGRVRQQNEDCYHADPDSGLWLVADGMGGRQAGEVASAIITEFIPVALKQGTSLPESVGRSHQAVLAELEKGRGVAGMGSTAVVLQMKDDDYEIAWVGDSRAYLWNGELHPLTRDHTVVQRLLEAGAIDAQQAREHPHRSSLIQALGSTEIAGVEVETIKGTLSHGEQILLCSDGLTSEVSDEQIAGILNEPLNAQEKVDQLIQAALDNGGKDNVTVLLISATSGEPSLSDTIPLDRIRAVEKTIPIDRSAQLASNRTRSRTQSVHSTWFWVGLALAVTAGLVVLIRWLSLNL